MEQNCDLKERLKRREEEVLGDLMQDLKYEKNRRNELEAQREEAKQKYGVLKKEHDSLIAIKERKEAEEQTLRKKLKEAETTTKDLMEKVTQLQLEKMKRMGSLGAI
ncbi:protein MICRORCHIDIA 7-like [Bidens hawaiensis]|uniref:protein MICRORCHIDIA 7-like n=1 Tax=Bidens hawaiensis TaxID=980011 RepID=UPI00404A5851